MSSTNPRRPRVFTPDDPALKVDVSAEAPHAPRADASAGTSAQRPPAETSATDTSATPRPTVAELKRGFRWGSVLLSALSGLFLLGLGAWFARIVSAALAREDIIGWTAYGLMIVAAVAAGVLVVRELIGFSRLSRLTRIKADVTRAIGAGDVASERTAVRRIRALYAHRQDIRWGLARFREHEQDIHDAGGLMALAERELVAPLDGEARRAILASARRVAVVTAISPVFVFAILYVLVENVRMLRGLATLYGGRPGVLGALRLGRMVIGHIVATGGLALTDDLVGQFLGQDLVRRLSRRLGEGVFNGALTARIGAAAIDVCRPLPFLEARPIRVRDLVGEVVRSLRRGEEKADTDPARSSRIDR
ncbi:MAG: TIGR01620 family protein [Hyphomicrobiaceae bacterium]|nr:TIGR01620 family protein [Hyphomicrobiaceae bacterium]